MTDYPLQTYRRYFGNIETGKEDNSRSQQWITARRVRLASNALIGTLSPTTPTSIAQPIIYTKKMNTDSQEVIFDNELITGNVTELNKYLASVKELILCVNIRSLNANYNK